MATLVDKFFSRVGREVARHLKQQRQEQRNAFAAGAINRLTNDWTTSTLSSDAQLRQSFSVLRARSRQLRDDEPYASKFVQLCRTNVIGEKGVHMRMRAKKPNGELDTDLNEMIEEAWKAWGSRKNCTVSGNMSWADVQRTVIETAVTDGEVLCRPVIRYPNEFGFALQVMEGDYLDDKHNDERAGAGNSIRMGVELDRWRKPVAYHIWTVNPSDSFAYAGGSSKRERVPAEQIIHVFHQRRPEQTRGIPWMITAMPLMKMLGGYAEAEVVASRVAADKMGFFTREGDAEYQGEKDAQGNRIMDAEPGSFEELPPGMKLESWDPQHPNSNYGEFVKSCLRGVAAAWGVSYHSLSNDLESVNFSSGRLGSGDERELWKAVQCWLIETFHHPVFEAWLEVQITNRIIDVPPQMFEDCCKAAEWRARRWQYIDPTKEIAAAAQAIEMGLTSRTRWLAEQQIDFRDVAEELAEEENIADELEIEISAKPAAAAPGQVDGEDAPDQEGEPPPQAPPARNNGNLARHP